MALGFFRESLDAPLQAFQVGEHQLGLDGVDVADRVELAAHMRDVLVLETAHDVRKRIHLAHVREKLVAKAFSPRGAADQARDIDERQARGLDLG